MRRAAALATLLLAAAAAFAQTTYRWVDDKGVVHFSDQPPPQSVRKVEERTHTHSVSDAVVPYAVRRAAADFPVTLYTTESCGALCDQARGALSERGVPFSEVVLRTEEDLANYRQLFGQPDEVPALTVGRHPLRGFSATQWNRQLDQVGYPPRGSQLAR